MITSIKIVIGDWLVFCLEGLYNHCANYKIFKSRPEVQAALELTIEMFFLNQLDMEN